MGILVPYGITFDAVGVFGLTFDFLLKICLSILWGKCEEGGLVSGGTCLAWLIGFFLAFEFES